jgi:hypothetical protein
LEIGEVDGKFARGEVEFFLENECVLRTDSRFEPVNDKRSSPNDCRQMIGPFQTFFIRVNLK